MRLPFGTPRWWLAFLLADSLLVLSVEANTTAITPAPATPTACEAVELVAAGSAWKYFVTANAPSDEWKAAGFDDSGWASGMAQLGYGGWESATLCGSSTAMATKRP